jgi:hypothetical protein
MSGISNEKRTHSVSPCFSKEKIRRKKFLGKNWPYHLILKVTPQNRLLHIYSKGPEDKATSFFIKNMI